MTEKRIRQLEKRSRVLLGALNKERVTTVDWIIKSAVAGYRWSWRSIESLPESGQVIAGTEDGRIMIWDAKILRSAMAAGTPSHLQFPAIAWMPKPNAPTRKTVEQCQVRGGKNDRQRIP